VKILYGQYVIKSDFLVAKTSSVDTPEVKIIEANKNIYFSNNKDISAKGDKLFMDVDKKLISIEGNVEFSQGKSIIRADKINVDLVTETVDFEGIKDSFIEN
jgi:lipopolysaccharide assembly outer membrane protein LptD (OstA)